MGTLMHYGKLLPAFDREAKPGDRRWVEVLTSHSRISLHVGGNLNEQDDLDGTWVELSPEELRKLIRGLDSALTYEGHEGMFQK